MAEERGADLPCSSLVRKLLCRPGVDRTERHTMLWTVAVVLFILWGLGLVTSYTLGGFIHILLLLAVVSVAIRLIQGRRVLP
jgi:hypothetical protein